MESTKKLTTLDQYCEAANYNSGEYKQYLKHDCFFQFLSDDYGDIQLHSTCIDKILDIPVQETEKRLREVARELLPGGTVESWSKAMHDGVTTWIGLNPAQLQTPYAEFFELLEELKLEENETLVDLGAGYGRLGQIMNHNWPSSKFIGFEMASERVEIGNESFKKLDAYNAILEQANIAADDFELPVADYYFIYEFGSVSDMKKLLSKLEERADQRKSFTVAARGRGINSLIRETAPWLTVEAREFGNSTIYAFIG